MVEVPKQIAELIAKNPNDKTRLQRAIEAADREMETERDRARPRVSETEGQIFTCSETEGQIFTCARPV